MSSNDTVCGRSARHLYRFRDLAEKCESRSHLRQLLWDAAAFNTTLILLCRHTTAQNPSFIPVEPWQVGAAAFGSQAPNPAGWDVSAATSYQYWPITFCVHFVGDVWPMMFGIIWISWKCLGSPICRIPNRIIGSSDPSHLSDPALGCSQAVLGCCSASSGRSCCPWWDVLSLGIAWMKVMFSQMSFRGHFVSGCCTSRSLTGASHLAEALSLVSLVVVFVGGSRSFQSWVCCSSFLQPQMAN